MSVEMTYRSVVTITDEQFEEIKNTIKMGDFVEGDHNIPEYIKQRAYVNMSLSKMAFV